MKKIVLVLLIAAFVSSLSAVSFAVSKNLFKIERNKNANVVMYDVVFNDDGTINAKKPIDAYWLLFAKDGKREELGMFDKKAYGYSVKADADGSYLLTLTPKPVKNRPIKIVLINGEPKGIIKINGNDAYLTKVYVFAKSLTDVELTLIGADIKTGAAVEEKIKND
jgi:hypothetical protein